MGAGGFILDANGRPVLGADGMPVLFADAQRLGGLGAAMGGLGGLGGSPPHMMKGGGRGGGRGAGRSGLAGPGGAALIASPNRKRERLAAAQAAAQASLGLDQFGMSGGVGGGSSQESLMEDEIERKHAEAVELFVRLFSRRNRTRSLGLGIKCWVAFWEARRASFDKLRWAAHRMFTARMSTAFYEWEAVWREGLATRASGQLREQAQALSAQLRDARFELGQLSLVRSAREDEIARLRESLQRAEADAARREKDLSECHEALKGSHDLQQRHQAAIEAARLAAAQRDEAENDVTRMRSKNQEMLESLLSEQHANFTRQVESLKGQLRGFQEAEEDRLRKFKAELQAEQDAKVQQAKVDLLQQQAGRRLRYFSSYRCWMTWVQWCDENRHAMERIRWAGERLQRLNEKIAFNSWAEMWRSGELLEGLGAPPSAVSDEPPPMDPTLARLLAAEKTIEEVTDQRDRLSKELAELAENAARERAAVSNLEGYVHRQLSRHLRHNRTVHAFAAWVEMWTARTEALGKLRHGIDRLFTKLDVARAFEVWTQISELIQSQSADRLGAELEAAARDLEQQRQDYERRLAEAAEEMTMALSRQRVQLEEERANEAAELEQQQRLVRTEALKKRMMRHLMSQEISIGWEAWCELVDAKRAAIHRLDDLGSRCRRTDIFNAMRRWTTFNKAELKSKLRAEQAVRTRDALERKHAQLSLPPPMPCPVPPAILPVTLSSPLLYRIHVLLPLSNALSPLV